MQALGERPLEVAATLRASPFDTFFSVVLPLCKPGLVTGAIMTFAHTVGEFGVVLMVGGNIPGVTRVVSVQIYDHVEAMEYADAHRLAAVMLGEKISGKAIFASLLGLAGVVVIVSARLGDGGLRQPLERAPRRVPGAREHLPAREDVAADGAGTAASRLT